MRLGTYVLNAGFYKPALLARDAAEVDPLSDGRLDFGLGAGYVREEFEAAELPYPTARQRVDYLEHVTTYMKKHLPTVPILIAGNGNRLLTVAAQHADIIGLTGASSGDAADPLAERVEFVRERRRRPVRRSRVEPRDHRGAVRQFRQTRLWRSPADSWTCPTKNCWRCRRCSADRPRDIADTLRGYREKYGLTSFTFQENHVDTIAKVIAELR